MEITKLTSMIRQPTNRLTISQWTRDAAEQLANVGIASALLDAEIILAHTLRKSRTWLHAHDDTEMSARELDIADARLDLRLDRVPVAYIIGHKEFYTRLFKVTPSVLIPRPESEAIITLLKQLTLPEHPRLIDVGTGSGCLGITAKCERPEIDVTLVDIDRYALTVAAENAKNLRVDVTILRSDLLHDVPGKFDVVVANLPYVDTTWERSPETNHEPSLALFAKHHGLALIMQLLDDLPSSLNANGYTILEADPEQHAALIAKAKTLGLSHQQTEGYAVLLQYHES